MVAYCSHCYSLLLKGTWGKVKLGIDRRTQKKVAIKILDKQQIRQQNMGVQIKREVNILKKMKNKNPHVVQLFEVLASKVCQFDIIACCMLYRLFV